MKIFFSYLLFLYNLFFNSQTSSLTKLSQALCMGYPGLQCQQLPTYFSQMFCLQTKLNLLSCKGPSAYSIGKERALVLTYTSLCLLVFLTKMPHAHALAAFRLHVWAKYVIVTHKTSVNEAGRSMGISFSSTSVSKLIVLSPQTSTENV